MRFFVFGQYLVNKLDSNRQACLSDWKYRVLSGNYQINLRKLGLYGY